MKILIKLAILTLICVVNVTVGFDALSKDCITTTDQ